MLNLFVWPFILMPVFMIPVYIDVKDNIPQLISLIIFGMIFSIVGIFFGNLFGCFDKFKRFKTSKVIYCKKDSFIIEEETKIRTFF